MINLKFKVITENKINKRQEIFDTRKAAQKYIDRLQKYEDVNNTFTQLGTDLASYEHITQGHTYVCIIPVITTI